ncbi:extensin-like isoform X2 [Bufo gargarizans]|nr:extensin-like isoform X2 [Bufo gargarizans]
MRDLNHERTAPSGSGTSRRKPYQYAPHLQFLQRCFQQRMTHSSTLPPEAEPVEHEDSTEQLSGRSTDQTSLPSQSQDSALESRGRQTETCAQIENTRQFSSSAFDRVLSRPRPLRRPHRVFEDLALIFRDCLLKIEEEQTRYKQELTSMINHVKVVCRPEPLNHNHQFLLTLSHWMDNMTPEQNCDCRVTLIKTVWNIKHAPSSNFVPLAQSYPPATSYPTSMTSPPAHSYSEPHIAPQSQNFQQSQNLALSQNFSHSQNFPPSKTLPTYHNFPQAQNVGTAQNFPALQNFPSTSHIFIPSQSHPPSQRQPTSHQYPTAHTFPPSQSHSTSVRYQPASTFQETLSQSQSQLPSYVSAQTPFQSNNTGSSQTRLQTPSPDVISMSTPNKISINEGVSTSVFPTPTTFTTPFSNKSVPYQSDTDSYSLHTPQHQQQGEYVRPQHSFMQSLLDQSAEDAGSPTAAPGKAPFTQPPP